MAQQYGLVPRNDDRPPNRLPDLDAHADDDALDTAGDRTPTTSGRMLPAMARRPRGSLRAVTARAPRMLAAMATARTSQSTPATQVNHRNVHGVTATKTDHDC